MFTFTFDSFVNDSLTAFILCMCWRHCTPGAVKQAKFKLNRHKNGSFKAILFAVDRRYLGLRSKDEHEKRV